MRHGSIRAQGLMAVPMTERDGALVAGTPQKLFLTLPRHQTA
jgi:hypothetical protein